MPDPMRVERRAWSARKKTLVHLALLPVWLLLAELAFRGVLHVQGHPHDAQAARSWLEEWIAKQREQVDLQEPEAETDPAQRDFLSMWHPQPFTGFDSLRSLEVMSKAAHDSLAPADPSVYHILIVGGSVAGQFTPGGTGALREKLLADPRFSGLSIKFTNYARPGYKAPQMSMEVAFLIDLGVRFDAVIDIDGYNETALSSYNAERGAHPDYPYIDQWAHVAGGRALDRASLDFLLDARAAQNRAIEVAEFALDHAFHASSILTRVTRLRLAGIARAAQTAREAYVEHLAKQSDSAALLGPELQGGDAAVLDAIERNWEESSRTLALMCGGRSILYLHVLQPTLHDAGSKPLTAGEIEKGGAVNPTLIAGVRNGYPRLREAGKRLASEGVSFLDASRLFVDVAEPVYVDQCHLNTLGNQILSQAIGEAFLRAAAAQGSSVGRLGPR